MILYNLTDVPTPELESRGLVNVPLAVHTQLIPPGESIEMEDGPHVRRQIQSYVVVGAMAVDVVPPEYAVRKARLPRPEPATAGADEPTEVLPRLKRPRDKDA